MLQVNFFFETLYKPSMATDSCSEIDVLLWVDSDSPQKVLDLSSFILALLWADSGSLLELDSPSKELTLLLADSASLQELDFSSQVMLDVGSEENSKIKSQL